MTTAIATGTRLRSQVCSTEVIVIKPPPADSVLSCGGVALIGFTEEPNEELRRAGVLADSDGGTLMGKRYSDSEDSLELLVTKPGQGSLAVNGTSLIVKTPRPLPSSD